MNSLNDKTVPLAHIAIPDHMVHDLNADALAALEKSIESEGLLHPITVSDRGNGTFQLVAGYRRLIACNNLHHEEIACVVTSESDATRLLYIGLRENLDRCLPTGVERGELLLRAKEAYEAMHPQARAGAAGSAAAKRKRKHQQGDGDDEPQKVESFAKAAAPALGLKPSAVTKAVTNQKAIRTLPLSLRTVMAASETPASLQAKAASLSKGEQDYLEHQLTHTDKEPHEVFAEIESGNAEAVYQVESKGDFPSQRAAMSDDDVRRGMPDKPGVPESLMALRRNDAVLYHRILADLAVFRKSVKAHLADLRATTKRGVFFTQVSEVVTALNPLDWPTCTHCWGKGYLDGSQPEGVPRERGPEDRKCHKCRCAGYSTS